MARNPSWLGLAAAGLTALAGTQTAEAQQTLPQNVGQPNVAPLIPPQFSKNGARVILPPSFKNTGNISFQIDKAIGPSNARHPEQQVNVRELMNQLDQPIVVFVDNTGLTVINLPNAVRQNDVQKFNDSSLKKPVTENNIVYSNASITQINWPQNNDMNNANTRDAVESIQIVQNALYQQYQAYDNLSRIASISPELNKQLSNADFYVTSPSQTAGNGGLSISMPQVPHQGDMVNQAKGRVEFLNVNPIGSIRGGVSPVDYYRNYTGSLYNVVSQQMDARGFGQVQQQAAPQQPQVQQPQVPAPVVTPQAQAPAQPSGDIGKMNITEVRTQLADMDQQILQTFAPSGTFLTEVDKAKASGVSYRQAIYNAANNIAKAEPDAAWSKKFIEELRPRAALLSTRMQQLYNTGQQNPGR